MRVRWNRCGWLSRRSCVIIERRVERNRLEKLARAVAREHRQPVRAFVQLVLEVGQNLLGILVEAFALRGRCRPRSRDGFELALEIGGKVGSAPVLIGLRVQVNAQDGQRCRLEGSRRSRCSSTAATGCAVRSVGRQYGPSRSTLLASGHPEQDQVVAAVFNACATAGRGR